jgi:hypothetical protein
LKKKKKKKQKTKKKTEKKTPCHTCPSVSLSEACQPPSLSSSDEGAPVQRQLMASLNDDYDVKSWYYLEGVNVSSLTDQDKSNLVSATARAVGIGTDKVKALLIKPDDCYPGQAQVAFDATLKLSPTSPNASGKEFDSTMYWGFDELDKFLWGCGGGLAKEKANRSC